MEAVSTTPKRSKVRKTRRLGKAGGLPMGGVLSLAEKQGLLSGARTLIVRGRMPEELVAEAKRRTGITSDTKLLQAALANIAVADDYWEWMQAHRGTISPDLDLEF